MKTIIIYATKHGAAGEIAQRIADKMDGTAVHNLKKGSAPSLEDFDCVIIGTSLYAGMIRGEVKAFLSQNAGALQGKKLGLFLSGLDAGEEKINFDRNFPPEILKNAKAAGFFGGIFDPKKAGLVERLVMKVVAKKSAYENTIDDSRIEQFVKTMKA